MEKITQFLGDNVALMRSTLHTGFAVAALAVLASCTSPEVVVQTDQGPVTCQLYRESVTWMDEAVNKPAGMSDQAADDICRQEGKKRQGN